MRTARKPITTRRFAAAAIALVGVIHLALAADYLDEATYLGVLFIAGGVALLYVGIRLWIARDIVAWAVGGVAAGCMFIGFILSRTVGLPSFHESEWEASGIVTLILEAAYLAAMAWWLSSRPRRLRAVDEAVPPVPGGVREMLTQPRANSRSE
jgi:hypothetical protein